METASNQCLFPAIKFSNEYPFTDEKTRGTCVYSCNLSREVSELEAYLNYLIDPFSATPPSAYIKYLNKNRCHNSDLVITGSQTFSENILDDGLSFIKKPAELKFFSNFESGNLFKAF